ncbi:MAG: hypothetical protein ACP5SH_26480 [Syntrophobacteraceae bacterium]
MMRGRPNFRAINFNLKTEFLDALGQSLADFRERLGEHLNRLHEELKTDTYMPQPVRQHQIPKAGQPGKFRSLGIPTIYDRVFQQALVNRLEPTFEAVFDDANFGYRTGKIG